MDSYPGQMLANQINSYARSYPRLIQPFYSDEKEEKEPYLLSTPSMRYQASVRRPTENDNHDSLESANQQQEKNGSEPADLSVKNGGEATGNPENTRLLREILQGRKPDSDEVDDENVSNAGSSFDEDSENEIGSKDDGAAVGIVEPNDDPDAAVKKARVENIVSNMRAPSVSTSSSENSGSDGNGRKKQRKQVCPKQQVERDAVPQEVLRRQLNMMQEQIEVMQGRYQNGRKRPHDNMIGEDVILSHVQRRLEMAGGSEAAAGKLAALISTEIQEQINPIISSVLSKYLKHPKENGTHITKSQTRTATPLPTVEVPVRSPSAVAVSPARNVKSEKPKQSVNDGVHSTKYFNPMCGIGFPPRPFFGSENMFGKDFLSMTHLASLANQAPTMFNPHFQHLLHRPPFFPEQTEAIPLVVTQRKKRHKVTDTRITPRVVNKIINQKEENGESRKFLQPSPSPGNGLIGFGPNGHPFLARSLSGRDSLQNSLNHSDASPFHPSMVEQTRQMFPGTQGFFPHGSIERREDSPMNGSLGSPMNDMNDQNSMDMSDASDAEMSAAGRQNTRSFGSRGDSLNFSHSSTLTPMHLRKAKLMFFFTRYPNSATLKTFFPDIKFNKNNTAQLVKWFSNFREFYYIQMEKYAKQALAEGVKNAEEIHVERESELFRILNLHYNRNNHIEVPDAFRDVVEETLREFFKAIQTNRDQEPSWKKSIYKVINRMDDSIPDFFKSPRFLDQLE